MLGRRFFITGIAAIVVLATTREASAYCRTTTCDMGTEDCRTNDKGCIRDGVPVVWSHLPIVYRFYKKGSAKIGDDKALRTAVKDAFNTWSSVQCSKGRTSVRFQQGDDITADKPLESKQASQPYGIYFRDKAWPHDDDNESLALTNQIYGERTGTIDYADIEVNTFANVFTLDDQNAEGIDFQSVMIHEAGHYLGLAHSLDKDSIMVARYCQSSDRCDLDTEAKRALSTDDEDAVCAVYPPAAPDASADEPATAGCTQSGTKSAELANAFALVFLASAILRRRLRSSR